MTLSIGDIAQLIAAVALVAGAAYWGGEMRALVRQLVAGQVDHEQRLRELEATPPPAQAIPIHHAGRRS